MSRGKVYNFLALPLNFLPHSLLPSTSWGAKTQGSTGGQSHRQKEIGPLNDCLEHNSLPICSRLSSEWEMEVYSLHPLRFIGWLLKLIAYHKTQAIIYFISPYKMCCYQKHNEYLFKHTPNTACTFTRFLCLHHAPQPQLYTFLLSKLLLPGFSSEEPTQMELMAFFSGFSQNLYMPLTEL